MYFLPSCQLIPVVMDFIFRPLSYSSDVYVRAFVAMPLYYNLKLDMVIGHVVNYFSQNCFGFYLSCLYINFFSIFLCLLLVLIFCVYQLCFVSLSGAEGQTPVLHTLPLS